MKLLPTNHYSIGMHSARNAQMKDSPSSSLNAGAISTPSLAPCAFPTFRVRRILGLTVAALTVWSLLAWGAAEALITRTDRSHAQVMVVLSNVGAYIERTHHAADLWKAGSAPTVLLTNDDLHGSWSQTYQRNLFSYEWASDELERSGVPRESIEILQNPVNSTFDEAVVVREYAVKYKLNSILVVTSAYHSRRALSIFRRVFKGTGVDIEINPAPIGQRTPQSKTWWLSRSGWRTVSPEYPKIAYFWLRQLFTHSPQSHEIVSESRGVAADLGTGIGPLVAPEKADVDEVVLIDARRSVGISRLPQADGSPSAVLDFGDGFTANLLASGHAYRTPGTYTIKLEGRNDTGQVVVKEERTIIVSNTLTALQANTRRLSDSGNAITNSVNLQRAINQAARSNSAEQEILLPAGATFAGPILLTTPNGPGSGNKYITIRSANLQSLPVSGDRVGPGDSVNMPTITAPSLTNAITPALSTPLPAPAIPSHHYRLMGLHFKKDSSNQSQVLVSLGDHNVGQRGYSMQPTNFIVDRCYFEGGSGTSNLGLRIAADFVTVKDSHFDNFKVASGIDAVAVAISKGKGPWALWNNYLEASSENFFVGGADAPLDAWSGSISSATTTSCALSTVTGLEVDQSIALPIRGKYGPDQSTIVRSISGNNITYDAIAVVPDNGGIAKWAITPSFLEFRRNYCYKPTRWRPSSSDYDGSNWQIKNLWETKTVRYAVMDGNVFRNSWVAGQAFAIVLTPANRNGFSHEAAVIRDLQWSNNIFWDMGNGPAILASSADSTYTTLLLSDVTFRNNVWRNVGENYDPTGGPYREFFGLLKGAQSTTPSKRVHFIHNTFDPGDYRGSGMAVTVFGTSGDGSGVTSGMFKNNLVYGTGHGFFSSISAEPAVNIVRFMPPGNSSNWEKNLIVNKGASNYPTGTIFQSVVTWSSQFTDYANGDFTLTNASRGKNTAADGEDIGVTMPTLKAATAQVITGQWMRDATTRPRVVSRKLGESLRATPGHY